MLTEEMERYSRDNKNFSFSPPLRLLVRRVILVWLVTSLVINCGECVCGGLNILSINICQTYVQAEYQGLVAGILGSRLLWLS